MTNQVCERSRTHVSRPQAVATRGDTTKEIRGATAPEPKTVGESIVLVDFDNVVVTAGEQGFPVSFTRLRSFLQQFGDIVLAFVFVPWKHRKDDDLVRSLSTAGFDVISCPSAYKDKDAVDTILTRMAHSIVLGLKGAISQIVIVSRDADFQPIATLARDHNLTPIFVDVLMVREEIEGDDATPQVYLAREGERFKRILAAYEQDLAIDHEQSPLHLPFLKDVMGIAATVDASRRLNFAELQRYVAGRLDAQWDRFKRVMLRSALSALREVGALARREENNSAYYSLNRESLLVAKLLEENRKKS